ncbi:MAG: hypothetical protein ICV60_18775 [Pyrinomonadaceae bacterium]|nr:hypothetical protein [Pyrinomonadaceae bacterium]
MAASDYFDSKPDKKCFTRLYFESETAHISSIELRTDQSLLFTLKATQTSVFTIRLNKYDLRDMPHFTGTAIEYKIKDASHPTVQDVPNGRQYTYRQIPPRIAGTDSAPVEHFDNMDVILTFLTPDTPEPGWITFDISFNVPALPASYFAWEIVIIYPELCFNNTDLSNYYLLNPTGMFGDFVTMATPVPNLPPPSSLMPVQFAALCKAVPDILSVGRMLLSGFALAGDDTLGHWKQLFYNSNKTTTSLSLMTQGSIHLNGATYVKPERFRLSAGDEFGFGGARMRYRIRAFDIESGPNGAPPDWYDVADIYRKWVKASQPTFYTKRLSPRHEQAPMDSMSPHTLISNYGMDAQIEANLNERLRRQLEIHPIKLAEDGYRPDTPGNTNESLQELLFRHLEQFNLWRNWEDLGSPSATIKLSSAPAVASNRLDVFVSATDNPATGNPIWHKYWDRTDWSEWVNMGGWAHSAPAAVASGNRLDVFVRGKDVDGKYCVYQKYWDGTKWSGWIGLGRPSTLEVTSAPAVASSAEGRMDLFVRAGTAMWHKLWVAGAGWSEWENLGGYLTSAPAAISRLPNRIDCFVIGGQNILYWKFRSGNAWSAWYSLDKIGTPRPFTITSNLSVASWGPNRLDVLARDERGALWQRTWNDHWGEWKRVGGSFKEGPGAFSWGPNRLDVFARSANDRLLHTGSYPIAQLEAQIWGFERGGLYRYLGGFPPATNAISGKPDKFQKAMQELSNHQVQPIITTDPLNALWDQRRFGGHIINGAEAIPYPFPSAFNYDPPNAQSCVKTTGKDLTERFDSNRVFLTSPCTNGQLYGNQEAQVYESSQILFPHQKRWKDVEWLNPKANNRFYPWWWVWTCPTPEIESLYLNNWLTRGVFSFGVKLIEFMQRHYSMFFCYDANHTHLVAPPAGLPYKNVIGQGAWNIKRMQQLLEKTRERGLAVNNSFMIVYEHIVPEPLIPYVDEFYEHETSSLEVYRRNAQPDAWATTRQVPLFQFIYSELLSEKMNLADCRPHEHPGYREKRKATTGPPSFMLDASRDNDSEKFNFDDWRSESQNYFQQNFDVADYGVAPKGYNTKGGVTYSYSRCVQNVFNLRSEIVRLGMAAVRGERILLHSTWFEKPLDSDGVPHNGPHDYDLEVINMAVRAALLQMKFAQFFRGGRMLGETTITSVNKSLWYWRAHRRNFIDVPELVRKLYTDTEIDGPSPLKLLILDYISRGTDQRQVTPYGKYPYQPHEEHEKVNAEKFSTVKIHHMIWQKDFQATGPQALYIFANVGNDIDNVAFTYTRGLDYSGNWKKTVRVFDGDPAAYPYGRVTERATSVAPGQTQTINIAARSLVAVQVFKQ